MISEPAGGFAGKIDWPAQHIVDVKQGFCKELFDLDLHEAVRPDGVTRAMLRSCETAKRLVGRAFASNFPNVGPFSDSIQLHVLHQVPLHAILHSSVRPAMYGRSLKHGLLELLTGLRNHT